ncbi:hypothetical protein HNQ56_002577 [Anaerotaenia torta]
MELPALSPAGMIPESVVDCDAYSDSSGLAS